MKSVLIAFFAILFCFTVLAEEGGEEKKAAPKPFKGSPVAAVLELPVVVEWKKWKLSNNARLSAWGESLNDVEGKKCWSIAVGESRLEGMQPMRRFCVPQDGTEILVESTQNAPDDVLTYMPYEKWVSQCKPTDKSQGNC